MALLLHFFLLLMKHVLRKRIEATPLPLLFTVSISFRCPCQNNELFIFERFQVTPRIHLCAQTVTGAIMYVKLQFKPRIDSLSLPQPASCLMQA